MKKEKSIKVSARKLYIVSFLVALLPRLIFLKWTYPVNIPVDEFSMFLPIAKILGWDWSGMIIKPLYYGYGFISFLIPLFALIDDGILLYRIIVVFMILAQALIAPCACYIIRRFFKIKDSKITFLISVSCSYMVTQRAVYVYNEFIYVFGIWIIAIILLLIQQNQQNIKKKRMLSMILALAMTYELTLHARALTLFIALGILCILYYWLYRRHFLSYISFGCIGVIGYFTDYYIKNRVTAAIFTENVGEVANATVKVSVKSLFRSAKALTGWMDITLGQINSMLIVTAGMAIFFVVIGCIFIWKTVIRDKWMVQIEENANYMILFAFFMAAMSMTIIALSFSWLVGVTSAIEIGGHNDALRSITYLRYYGAYFGPVVLAGMVYAYLHRTQICKLLIPCIIVVGILQIVWVAYIVPYLVGFGETSFDSSIYSWIKGWRDDITFYSYLPAVIVAFFGTLFFAWLYKKQKYEVAFGLFALVLIYGYSYQAINYEGYRGVENFKSVDSSYEMLQKVKDAGLLPETICVQDSGAKTLGYSTGSILQFLFKEDKITTQVPDVTEEEGIFLTGDIYNYPELLNNGYKCAQLDDEEFIYAKGEKLQKFLEKEGIELDKYLNYDTSMELYRFETDFQKHRSRTQICSDGAAGYLFYGYRFRYGGGELTPSVSLKLQGHTEEKIGTFEFIRSNGRDVYLSEDVYAEDFDEEGKLKLEIPVNTYANEAVELRLKVTEGSRVAVNDIRVSNISEYSAGKNNMEEIQKIGKLIEEFSNIEKIYFVDCYKTCKVNTDYLTKVWRKKVEVISWETFSKKDIEKEDAIFVIEGREGVFELAKKCSIVEATKNFTLFASEEQINKNQINKSVLSDKDGIFLCYFQRDKQGCYSSANKILLDGGTYRITVSTESEQAKYCMIRVTEYGEVVGEETFIKKEPANYTAEVIISNAEGFGELGVEILSPLGEEVEKQTVIHIQKVQD